MPKKPDGVAADLEAVLVPVPLLTAEQLDTFESAVNALWEDLRRIDELRRSLRQMDAEIRTLRRLMADARKQFGEAEAAPALRLVEGEDDDGTR